jgi:hypothetical protein
MEFVQNEAEFVQGEKSLKVVNCHTETSLKTNQN